jgi:hypothetical protein
LRLMKSFCRAMMPNGRLTSTNAFDIAVAVETGVQTVRRSLPSEAMATLMLEKPSVFATGQKPRTHRG